MAVIGKVNKQPADRIDYDIDCSDLVAGGDSIASVAAPVVTPTGLTADAFVISANTVKIWFNSGVTGVTYKVEVTVTTTLGRVKQDEIKVKVKDV